MRANTCQPGSGKKDLNRLPYLAELLLRFISTVNSTTPAGRVLGPRNRVQFEGFGKVL